MDGNVALNLPHIAILMAGHTLPPIREKYGDFDSWFQTRPERSAAYTVHYLYSDDTLPAPKESDGWIITGSPDSVHDSLAWLPGVRKQISTAVETGHPILGVCFGHQLLAHSLGAKVEINRAGWELGSATVQLTADGLESALFTDLGADLEVYQTHHDVVTDIPAGMKVLATNEMGIQAIGVGERIFGVQFHPEFSPGIAGMYVELRSDYQRGRIMDIQANNNVSHKVLDNFIRMLTR
jgi:GMP synthase (glutamine-hydrolysing)